MRNLILLFILVFVACEKENLYLSDSLAHTVDPVFVTSNEVLERAYQMASFEWTPVNPVPMRGGGYYDVGEKITGAPYSSVKEINTYLFQDVSYHTFMTAVHNPKSVLYTEDISQAPYHGLNCAPYYGSVCSSSVMWAFGFSIPFYADQMVELPFMQRLEYQVLDSLKVCDVLWKPGHVQMVFEIEQKDDTLFKVKLFETSGRSTHISTYSRKSFMDLWDDGGYVAYRYRYLSYSHESMTYRGFDAVNYNDDLCPSKGDMAVYRTDDVININVFNPNYNSIVLANDEHIVVSTESYNGDNHQFHGLAPGIYFVYLQSEGRRTEEVSFEVIDTQVYFNSIRDNIITIFFDSTATADYVALCKQSGGSLYYAISDTDRKKGFTVVPAWDYPEYYCKVIFRGEYGTVINRPIRVR